MSRKDRPVVRVVLGNQSEDQSQRFDVATDFLLADIVRRVLTCQGEKSNGNNKTLQQTLHQSAPLQ